jgi:hypothetical protein
MPLVGFAERPVGSCVDGRHGKKVENVSPDLDDACMPRGQRDRPGAVRRHGLKRPVSASDKLLDNRGGQTALALPDLVDVIAELAQPSS